MDGLHWSRGSYCYCVYFAAPFHSVLRHLATFEDPETQYTEVMYVPADLLCVPTLIHGYMACVTVSSISSQSMCAQ